MNKLPKTIWINQAGKQVLKILGTIVLAVVALIIIPVGVYLILP